MLSRRARRRVSEPTRWHPASVALHWLTFLLILFQFWVSGPMLDEKRDLIARFELYQLHKSVGLTIAAFVLLRLVLRVTLSQPDPENQNPWLRRAAALVHAALYLCIVALPISGLLMAAAAPIQIPTLYFGLFQVPHPIGPNPAIYQRMLWLHDRLGNILIVLGSVHVAAVAVHMLLWRDGLLGRMWFGRRWL
ncbi:cytochrome b [Bosea sp. AS-1]|uniref:cytochrome b n=1 Tax=Bosea sp. AS-1 TaxID=2015316 RepID=UPI0012FD331B|nr:cytochrome b [Bosea sp. AS-1]